ncbi:MULTISPECIES: hypothetical protein [Chryseobacterium]|uniref:hypothetical protein n=1 Tax=Chryseobacterium sp. R2A-55 TaxID=2744445 RepID=UPI001F347633|nr:hypothetical protein [Chryseobacterium sp. R2A-55]
MKNEKKCKELAESKNRKRKILFEIDTETQIFNQTISGIFFFVATFFYLAEIFHTKNGQERNPFNDAV